MSIKKLLRFLKPKSKEEKHREKLLKDYEEGKILKFEDPPQKKHKDENSKKQKKKNKNKEKK